MTKISFRLLCVVEQLVVFLYVLTLLMEQFFFFLPKVPFGKHRMFMYSIFPIKIIFFWIKFDCI